MKEDRSAVVEMLLGGGADIEAICASAGLRMRMECRDFASKRGIERIEPLTLNLKLYMFMMLMWNVLFQDDAYSTNLIQ